MATFDEHNGEHFEPREIVRVFSMGRGHGEESEEVTEVERAMINHFEHEESQRKNRIRQINVYLSSTRYEPWRTLCIDTS